MSLKDQAAKVASKKDLVAFLQALAADYGKNGKKWENGDLSRYLAALGGFAGEMNGYYKNQGLNPPDRPEWRTIAELLLAATMYE